MVVTLFMEVVRQFRTNPLAYISIPVVAALVGYGTNWVGVKMIFYPIKFWGINIKQWPEQPLGLIGWQGIVPSKVNKMSNRLVDIITVKLLSVKEAFARLDSDQLALLLKPSVEQSIEKEAPWGEFWRMVTAPALLPVLQTVTRRMQTDVEEYLDLRIVVSSAFMADKVLLGELFQKAGRKELDFLVNSGLGFGFILGIFQMALWILLPSVWALPTGGALVGYITNWVAIKLIFDPVEPTPVGPFIIQGLFEKRQPEVSVEFSDFLSEKVLTSQRLIGEMVNGSSKEKLEAMVRNSVPGLVPDGVCEAAVSSLRKLVLEPSSHPVHQYVDAKLDIRDTLTVRLQALSAADFENLLHPVFEEDEIILVVAGGVLGAAAGAVQMFCGWGGPGQGTAGALGAAVASPAFLLHPAALSQVWWTAAVGMAALASFRVAARRLFGRFRVLQRPLLPRFKASPRNWLRRRILRARQ